MDYKRGKVVIRPRSNATDLLVNTRREGLTYRTQEWNHGTLGGVTHKYNTFNCLPRLVSKGGLLVNNLQNSRVTTG